MELCNATVAELAASSIEDLAASIVCAQPNSDASSLVLPIKWPLTEPLTHPLT